MPKSREDIYNAALELDDLERAALIGMLLDSLDGETEEGAEAAWLIEIERRMEELGSGAVESIPWDAVRDRIRASLER